MCNRHPLLHFLSASWNAGSWVLSSTPRLEKTGEGGTTPEVTDTSQRDTPWVWGQSASCVKNDSDITRKKALLSKWFTCHFKVETYYHTKQNDSFRVLTNIRAASLIHLQFSFSALCFFPHTHLLFSTVCHFLLHHGCVCVLVSFEALQVALKHKKAVVQKSLDTIAVARMCNLQGTDWERLCDLRYAL